jgi:hypothetical protein
MNHHPLLDKIEAGEYRIVFHGSAQVIRAFTETGVGRGADCNSALGLFASEIPENAAEYAQNAVNGGEGETAHVYVVAIPCRKPYTSMDRNRFYGLDDDDIPLMNHAQFATQRRQLLAQGYDVVDYEGDGDDVISVCLSPEKALILADLSYEQALGLQEDGLVLFDSVSIYKQLIEKLPLEMAYAPIAPRASNHEGYSL